MSAILTMFQTFLYVLIATVLSFTGYEIYERRVERQEKAEVMRSLVDLHHVRTIGDVIEKQEEKQDKQTQAK